MNRVISIEGACERARAHVPHPSKPGALRGSRSAAPPRPSRPRRPYAASPSRAGGAAECPLFAHKEGREGITPLRVVGSMTRSQFSQSQGEWHKLQTQTWSRVDEQHLAQIPDHLYSQQDGHLSLTRKARLSQMLAFVFFNKIPRDVWRA